MLKKIFFGFFPFLRFLTGERRSAGKKIALGVNSFFALLTYYMMFILFAPTGMYATLQVHTKYFNFFDNTPFNASDKVKMFKVLRSLDKKIENDPLFKDGVAVDIVNVHKKIAYLLSSPANLIGYVVYKKTSIASTVNQRILVHSLDIKHDTMSEDAPIEAVLHHEAIHSLQFKKYGYVKVAILLPQWIREGYATYGAREEYPVFGDRKQIHTLLSRNPDMLTIGEKYIVWGLMVKHAIKDMHTSVDDLHRGKVSYDEVYRSLLAKYRLPNK